MPIIIFPAANISGGGGSSSSGGHSHPNSATLNRLSTDANGNLCFNGKIVGEKAIETAYDVTVTDAIVQQKFFPLPADCDTTRIITLALNGVAFAQGDFWEVRENVTSTTDFISWDGLSLQNLIQAGDNVLISYYRIV